MTFCLENWKKRGDNYEFPSRKFEKCTKKGRGNEMDKWSLGNWGGCLLIGGGRPPPVKFSVFKSIQEEYFTRPQPHIFSFLLQSLSTTNDARSKLNANSYSFQNTQNILYRRFKSAISYLGLRRRRLPVILYFLNRKLLNGTSLTLPCSTLCEENSAKTLRNDANLLSFKKIT